MILRFIYVFICTNFLINLTECCTSKSFIFKINSINKNYTSFSANSIMKQWIKDEKKKWKRILEHEYKQTSYLLSLLLLQNHFGQNLLFFSFFFFLSKTRFSFNYICKRETHIYTHFDVRYWMNSNRIVVEWNGSRRLNTIFACAIIHISTTVIFLMTIDIDNLHLNWQHLLPSISIEQIFRDFCLAFHCCVHFQYTDFQFVFNLHISLP